MKDWKIKMLEEKEAQVQMEAQTPEQKPIKRPSFTRKLPAPGTGRNRKEKKG